MARQQPESKLVNQIKNQLQITFPLSLWIKIHGGPYQQAGIADLIGCVEGVFFALEVKLPDKENTATKLQRHFLDEVQDAEGFSTIVTSPDEALDFIIKSLGYND